MDGNYFAVIPLRAITDKRLSAEEYRLLSRIFSLTNKRGFCWATNTTFANEFDVSVRAIQKWIKHLEELNYIIIETIRETEIANRPIRALIIAEATAPALVEQLRARTREIEKEKAEKSDKKKSKKETSTDSPSCNRDEPPFTPMGEPPFTPMDEPPFTQNKYNINKYNINKRACARDNTRSIKKQGANPSFCNFEQRNDDLTQLENAMLRKFLNPNGDDGG